ncbi:hypothetical protein BDY19DRAFT_886279 [Irpex rosettiformis]|uniref:Uncharacterized protein n=1 Tax=Irpex rosettiformis TaxID=378272 RepID=A0ACB8U9R1_9APHY|nr:hypothetical protein BDY19DRAFT_886279 [Irpex rosettiformis]
MQTGYRLRWLFATILIFCNPAIPAQLWQEFRQHICDDLRPQVIALGIGHLSVEDVCDYGLYLLDEILAESGYSLHRFGMPEPVNDWST